MKKLAKVLLYLFLIILILFGTIYIGSSYYLKDIISNKLEDKRIGGIYKVSFKNAYFNIFQMGITITEFELTPDSTDEYTKLYTYHKHLAHIKVNRLNIFQVDLKKFILDKEVVVHKVIFRKPEINIYKNNKFTKTIRQTNEVADEKVELSFIKLKSLSIDKLSFKYFIDEDKNADVLIGYCDLELMNPVIDLSKTHQLLEALEFDDISLKLKNIEYNDNSGLYNITLKSIDYIYSDHIFVFSNLSVKPNFNKVNFAKKHKYQSDRFDLTLSKLDINGLNIARLLSDNIIEIKRIDANGLNMEIYRDKNYPFNLNKKPKLPQQALRELKQKIEIDLFSLKASSIIYLEKAVDSKTTGKVTFANVQADITNIGNTIDWQNNKRLKVEANTMVFGKGKLNIHLDFPLKYNTFYMSGELGEMPMTAFNVISSPSAGIKVRSGVIKKMSFKATLRRTASLGTLSLYYKDLDISILKKKKKSGLRKESKLLNFAANSFIPENNPNKKGDFYEATILYEREMNKSVFGYMWKSIFSGLMDTVLKKNKKKTKKDNKKKRKARRNR